MGDRVNRGLSRYDVIVVGAGPAGSEAAVAAAGRGASVLCLTINLDTVGFHPADPTLLRGGDDRRRLLVAELQAAGAVLPRLLSRKEIATEAGRHLVADRRRLGLAFKEILENTSGLEPRQALATAIERHGDGWHVECKYGERFAAGSVVVATGTFLDGQVTMGGLTADGGRRGEIPSRALADCLQRLGISFTRLVACASPRISARGEPSSHLRLARDGDQLRELYASEIKLEGDSDRQLAELRSLARSGEAWLNRPSYCVSHLALAPGMVGNRLESRDLPGLFFAGRSAGVASYPEAAASGFAAGLAAVGAPPDRLTNDKKYVGLLCRRIAEGDRPVSVNDH